MHHPGQIMPRERSVVSQLFEISNRDAALATTSAVVARLNRAIQYAAAYRFNRWRLWNTGSPAFAGDDSLRKAEACANHRIGGAY